MKRVIEIKKVSKKFGKVNALNNVSLKINKNQIYGLLGSNGAGKTTLLHILMGLVDPSKGEVKIFEKSITKYSKLLKSKIAIVPQKISLYDNLTIYDNLYFFGKAYGFKKDKILERIEYLSKNLRLRNLKKKINELSGGYQRRVSLAIGLIGDPEILILDEALVGIDLETKNIVLDLLKNFKKNRTIIITTHDIQSAENFCDSICFLHKGKKIVEGKTQEIIKNYKGGLEEVFLNLII